MKTNHLMQCLVGVGAAAALLLAFGVQAGTLVYLAVALACPLMMVVMMRGMMGGSHSSCDHPEHRHGDTTGDGDRQPSERLG